jgi:hypothetical protein
MSVTGCPDVTSKVTRERPERGSLGRLRAAALIAVLAGAVASFGFMLRAGRRNHSRMLMAIMAVWVLSPFIALVWASLVSKCWPVLTRAAFYSVMLVVSLASLAVYGVDALRPPGAQAAFVFVVFPPVSWLLIAIVVALAAFISSRRSRRAGSA